MFELSLENETGSVININDNIRFMVVNASGLTPPQANIFLSSSPNRKGAKYNGSSIDERNVSITIKILGDIVINRNFLYDWVTSEYYTKIHYRNDVRNVVCEGYVELPDIDLFSSNELVELSIVCPDPYWRDLQEVVVEITNLLRQFTFPFAISVNNTIDVTTNKPKNDGTPGGPEETIVFSEGVPFSTLFDSNNTTITNEGNETGILITAVFHSDVTGFTFENARDVSQKIQFKNTFHFSNGDILMIDTDSSPKTINRINSLGQIENILKYVEGRPYWFTLKKGNNTFTYTSSNNSAIDLAISFTNKYLGV